MVGTGVVRPPEQRCRHDFVAMATLASFSEGLRAIIKVCKHCGLVERELVD